MARQLPGDTYVICEKRKTAFIWHECRICRVNFKWEPFFTIYTERDLKFPTDEDRERKIVRYYPHVVPQTICISCGEKFGLDKISTTATLHEEFNAMVDELHKEEAPTPTHDGTTGKMRIRSRETA